MNRALFPVALLCFAAIGASAQVAPRSEFTRPDPRLRLIERSDSYDKGSFARWRGRVPLEGKIVLEFDRPPPDAEQDGDEGVIFFEPSPASFTRLPSAVGRYYPLPAKVLWLGGTPSEVLTPLIGAPAVARLLSGKPPRFEVPAELVLLELFTSVECDHRSYAIKYESLKLRATELVAVGKAVNIGC